MQRSILKVSQPFSKKYFFIQLTITRVCPLDYISNSKIVDKNALTLTIAIDTNYKNAKSINILKLLCK